MPVCRGECGYACGQSQWRATHAGGSGGVLLHPAQLLILDGPVTIPTPLTCTLYAYPPTQLLLLDEPDSHLDLPALDVLEAVLRQYRGTLVVEQHDPAFLQAIGIQKSLQLQRGGWQLRVASDPGFLTPVICPGHPRVFLFATRWGA